MELIEKYFGAELSALQREQLAAMEPLYRQWNEKINTISRKDIDQLYLHHVLHSLAIAKVMRFPAGSTVMDLGCGGGFPGIPLATLFPDVRFRLVDSVGKKIIVADAVARSLGLKNVETIHARAEELNGAVDFVVSRAVTELGKFLQWSWKQVRGGDGRGVLYLKGGDLTEEIRKGCKGIRGLESCETYAVSDFFTEEFFETKKVLYLKKSKK